MTTKTRLLHNCATIPYLIELAKAMPDEEILTGLKGEAAIRQLRKAQADGIELIPLGPCDNQGPDGGCLGHLEPNADEEDTMTTAQDPEAWRAEWAAAAAKWVRAEAEVRAALRAARVAEAAWTAWAAAAARAAAAHAEARLGQVL